MARNYTGICLDCHGRLSDRSLRCPVCKKAHNKELHKQALKRYEEAHAQELLDRHAVYMKRKRREKSGGREIGCAMDPWLGRNYVIVRDPRPVDDGGFRAGSQFSIKDLQFMLSSGQVLLDGTLIENAQKKVKFEVRQGQLRRMA